MNERNKNRPAYNDLISKNPNIGRVLSEESWKYVNNSNDSTVDHFNKEWLCNIRKNIPLLKKCGSVAPYNHIGYGKAFIGVGAGPSLNLNKDILKEIVIADGVKHFDDQNFIIAVSNHSFKQCLEDGIIPHFVFLNDATDTVLDQLTKDIPKKARHTILLAGMHCHPPIIQKWHDQGRKVKMYLSSGKDEEKVYGDEMGVPPDGLTIPQGGNIINAMWSLALTIFHSTVFMCVGNDLSFPYDPALESRRTGYYSDGREGYDQNIANKRDEARQKFAWMGFRFRDRDLHLPGGRLMPSIDLEPKSTALQLWVYKTWIETQVAINEHAKRQIHYYNCSEQGILGVMAKDTSAGATMKDIKNWQLLDEILPKRWHTRRLVDAVHEFLEAKECLKQEKQQLLIVPERKGGILTNAAGAGVLDHLTDYVRPVGIRLQ